MREMKDSGVDWIAHIPTDWTTNKMKYLFSNGKGLSITKENLIETGLPVISYGQIHSKDNSGTDIKDTLLRYVDFQYQADNPQCEVFQHDFVFADTSEDYDGCGNCVYKRDTSLLFGGYHAIIIHSLIKHDNRFFAYLFKTDAWRKQLREAASGVKVFSITQKALMNCSIIIPPEDEQKEISDFLDAKCSELDTAVSDLQSQIEALEEYKRSVITEAVTKGLDPDVEMKDSGVQWIGKIPKHWVVDNPKWHFVQRKDRARNGLTQLTASQKYGVVTQEEYMEITGAKVVTVEKDFDILKLVCPGDFIIHMRSFQGGLEYSEKYGSISSAYVMLIPQKTILEPRYYKWFFKSPVYIDALSSTSNLIRDGQAMRYANFVQLPIILMPKEEQQQIADYLDNKCAEIDAIIAEKKHQIETIEKYKKSLIFEYVTGKKEVTQ